jgi:hypothetical protein
MTRLHIDAYESMATGDGGRWLRQPATFLRWRPDLRPDDRLLDQLRH